MDSTSKHNNKPVKF